MIFIEIPRTIAIEIMRWCARQSIRLYSHAQRENYAWTLPSEIQCEGNRSAETPLSCWPDTAKVSISLGCTATASDHPINFCNLCSAGGKSCKRIYIARAWASCCFFWWISVNLALRDRIASFSMIHHMPTKTGVLECASFWEGHNTRNWRDGRGLCLPCPFAV